jgi:uncharacterized protein YukE
MAALRETIERDLNAFRQLRDELRVQSELGRADLRDRVQELERRWHQLEARFDGVRKDARHDAEDVREALRLLGRELKESVDHLRGRLS